MTAPVTDERLHLPWNLTAAIYAVASRVARIAIAVMAFVTRGFVPSGLGLWLIAEPHRFGRAGRTHLPFQALEARSADGLRLHGWLFSPDTTPKGIVVYLHGKDQSRGPGAKVAERYVPKGFAVLTFDQRGHGASEGKFCTYGIHEVSDLERLLDLAPKAPVYLIGESLGGSVGLLTAAADSRIAGLVAAAPYADLEQTIRERAGALKVDPSLARFEREAGIRLAEAAPLAVAPRIRVPVLLVHGSRDRSTQLHHSVDLFAALPGPKELVIVEGAAHGDILKHERVWQRIDAWLERVAVNAGA